VGFFVTICEPSMSTPAWRHYSEVTYLTTLFYL
jgi:hypothetical protein